MPNYWKSHVTTHFSWYFDPDKVTPPPQKKKKKKNATQRGIYRGRALFAMTK